MSKSESESKSESKSESESESESILFFHNRDVRSFLHALYHKDGKHQS